MNVTYQGMPGVIWCNQDIPDWAEAGATIIKEENGTTIKVRKLSER